MMSRFALQKSEATLLSPCDLPSCQAGELVLLGGRVLQSTSNQLVLADFKAIAVLELAEATKLQPGDFALCEIVAAGETADLKWSVRRIRDHYPHPEPVGSGELLRLQDDGRGRALAARSLAAEQIRRYFQEQGFVEVTTPTFAPSPGLDAHVASLASVQVEKRKHYLITSPEFHMKRLLSGGMPRIYQLARCFRADEQGISHEPEFTLLEWYRAFRGFEALLDDTEQIVSRVFQALNPSMKYREGTVVLPFFRMTVRQAFLRFCPGVDPIRLSEEDSPEYFRLLIEEIEPAIASMGRPVFLTHYPLSQGALARAAPEDPTVAERFELYMGSVEISNGYGELTDPVLQRKRFEREQERRRLSGEDVYPIDERFLDALKQGLPPCSGNAVGFDRLVALALGSSSIQKVMAFSDAER